MPAGIEVLNTSGNILIDQNYKTMQLAQKVSSTTVTSVINASGYFARRIWQFTFPYTDAIYAVSQSGGSTVPLICSPANPSGGSTLVTVSTHSSLNGTFDLFVFTTANQIAAAGNVGIEVYTADGQLGFGGQYKPLRVISQFEWRQDTGGEDTGGFFVDDDYAESHVGKRVACIFSRHATALDGDGSFINRTTPVFTSHFANNPSTGDCRLSWLVTRNAGKDIPYWERPGRYMFIDVTNY